MSRWLTASASVAEMRRERDALLEKTQTARERGDFVTASVLATRALELLETELGSEHPDVAALLNASFRTGLVRLWTNLLVLVLGVLIT